MNHCIIVEISRHHVSFYSNSDQGFIPFNEAHRMPLAIMCAGNSISIGEEALRAHREKTPNAFYEIFDVINTPEHFVLRGQQCPQRMLLFYALDNQIKNLYDRYLESSQGPFVQNFGHLPIGFIFKQNVSHGERNLLMSQFLDRGYARVFQIDYDRHLLWTMSRNGQLQTQGSRTLLVSSDNKNLYVKAIENQTMTELRSFELNGRGEDPRCPKVEELLWNSLYESLGNVYYYIDRDNADNQEKIRTIAEMFLASGKKFTDEDVSLYSSEYGSVPGRVSVELRDINLDSIADSGAIMALVYNELASIGFKDQSDYTVILKDRAASSQYFERIFREGFASVYSTTRETKVNTFAALYEAALASNFEHIGCTIPIEYVPDATQGEPVDAPKTTIIDPEPVPTPEPAPIPTPEPKPVPTPEPKPVPTPVPKPGPSKDWEREYRRKVALWKGRIRSGNTTGLMSEIKAFQAELHAAGVTDFDERICVLIAQIEDTPTLPPDPQPQPTPQPQQKDWEREYRRKVAPWKGRIRSGNTTGLASEIKAFQAELHAAGVTDFDERLDGFIAQIKNTSTPPPPPPPHPSEPLENNPEKVKAYRRDVRHDTVVANNHIKAGKKSEARTILQALLDKLHKDRITAFDAEIQGLLNLCSTESKPNPDKLDRTGNNPGSRPKAPTPKSEAEKLFEAGNFKEAKKAFAREGNSAKAKVCSELVMAKRRIESYLEEAKKAEAAHTPVVGKDRKLIDLNGYLALFTRHGANPDIIHETIKHLK